jgi:hypothetical protein
MVTLVRGRVRGRQEVRAFQIETGGSIENCELVKVHLDYPETLNQSKRASSFWCNRSFRPVRSGKDRDVHVAREQHV